MQWIFISHAVCLGLCVHQPITLDKMDGCYWVPKSARLQHYISDVYKALDLKIFLVWEINYGGIDFFFFFLQDYDL